MHAELPLSGITVISCEQAVAAPFASRQLADLGARVIKIERPETGDFARGYDTTVNGMASHFVWLNRNKESLSLDLKHPQGKEILKNLVAEADVFIQNFAPGAAERLGFGADELRAANERLIYASISGYGPDGPYKDAKAYDALVQAEAGLVSVTGTEDHPAKTGISTADISAGMYTYSGILTALFNREKTGEGATLQISLFDSLVEWMGYPLYFTKGGGT
ncbi:MAG: CoA transferase, partial [Brevibacterium sp.]|nr:CoA transferase [Brevibacterium sp.]